MRIIELFRVCNIKPTLLLGGLFVILFSSHNNAQCPISLGCNDAIQISLDFDCDAEMTPELILEDERDNCDYMVNLLTENDIVVASTNIGLGGELEFPRVDGSFIGQRWKAEVFFINDNNNRITCWGYFTVEDKLPPEISCIDDFTINCNENLSDLFTSSSSVTYTSMGDDLDSNPNTVTVAMCAEATDIRPQPWEVIESMSINYLGISTGSGSSLLNGSQVFFNNVGNVVSGNIIGTQVDTSTCINFVFDRSTVPMTGITTTINSVSFFDFQIIDNCDPNLQVLITLDEIQRLDCVNDITAERVIRYFTQDQVGLSADFCEFRIAFEKKELSEIVFPPNFTVECTMRPPSLDPIYTGQPMLDGSIIVDGDNLCNLNVTFIDDTFNLCGSNTTKILRRWTALDWCVGQFSQSYQTIIVEDTSPPIVSCPFDDMVFLSGVDCTASVIFAPLDTMDRTGVVFRATECSTITVQVEYLTGDQRDPNDIDQPFNPARSIGNNRFIADGLQNGRNWIRYVFTDECGFTSECRFEILVVDDNAPVPVCDQFTVVSLDDSGWGRIFPLSIDDGSFDKCGGPVDLAIRRSNTFCDGESMDTLFGNFVSFCCEEAGDTVLVQLKVADDGGRTNTCEVNVVVQDKSGFNVTCPSRLNIDLDCSEINNIGTDIFGTVIISDDCGAGMITDTDDKDFDSLCGQGQVIREFSITFSGITQLLPQCTQTFNFSSDIVLTRNSFTFPRDRDDATCQNFSTDLGDAPTFRGLPVNQAAFCGNLTYTFEDLVFERAEGVCVKIIRTWTVIDWCTYDPDISSTVGIWSDTQIIRVIDSQGPELSSCSDDLVIDIDNNDCIAEVSFLAPTALDLCRNEGIDLDDIQYDISGSNRFSMSGTGNIPNIDLGIGNFTVVWSAEGICGNVSRCSHTVTVNDVKAPTPYCRNGVVTVLMEDTNLNQEPMVVIWANDFDLGSTDNCGPVQLSFSTNTNNVSRSFDCSELGINVIEMWVTDESGNQDFCSTTINIQANDDICPDRDGAMIAGMIGTEYEDIVEGVEVVLLDMKKNTVELSKTDLGGQFAFPDNNINTDYRVSVSSNNDYLNGVSTLDLLLMQRHILGSELLDSPYKVVAADIDNSKNISAIDLIELRKLILGIYDELPKNESWRFIDKTQGFINPLSPWPLEEQIEIHEISDDMMYNDFVAVKVGDVNNTVVANLRGSDIETRSSDSKEITNEILELSSGKYLIPFYLKEAQEIQGLQLYLNTSEDVKILEIESGKLKLNATNYNLTEDGIKLLWHDTELISIGEDEALFYLTVSNPDKTIYDGLLRIGEEEWFKSELYTRSSEAFKLVLDSYSEELDNQLYQNTPNPFNNRTQVSFDLKKSMDVQFMIYDVNGRIVYSQNKYYNKGHHFIEVQSQDLDGTGVYYYQLSSESYSDSRKMIFIE